MRRKSSLRVPKYNVCRALMRRQLDELRDVRTMSMDMSLSDDDLSCSDLACSKVDSWLAEGEGKELGNRESGDGRRPTPENHRRTRPTELQEGDDASSVAGKSEQEGEEWRRTTLGWIEEEGEELQALLGESEALQATLEKLDAREISGEKSRRRRQEERSAAQDSVADVLDKARLAVEMTRAAARVWEGLRDVLEEPEEPRTALLKCTHERLPGRSGVAATNRKASAQDIASIVLEKARVAVGMTQVAVRVWEEMRDVLGESEEQATLGKSDARETSIFREEEANRRRRESGGAQCRGGCAQRSQSHRRNDMGRSKSVGRRMRCERRSPPAPQTVHHHSNGKNLEAFNDIFQDVMANKDDETITSAKIIAPSLTPRLCRSSNRHGGSVPLDRTVRYIKSPGARKEKKKQRQTCNVKDGPPDLQAHRPTSREKDPVLNAVKMR